jgi:hypothetical protein
LSRFPSPFAMILRCMAMIPGAIAPNIVTNTLAVRCH